MRQDIANQMLFGSVDISEIKIDLKSRDEIDDVVTSLKFIYTTPAVREEIFKYLEETVLKKKSKRTGRPGMDLWKILVLGAIRVSCKWDYDKLQNIANNHYTIRAFLGHSEAYGWDGYKYNLQTLKDNISLFEEAHLHSINTIIVNAAHKYVIKIKKDTQLNCSADSFVVETNIHYPTDINLLLDCMRKSLQLTRLISNWHDIPGLRQSNYHIRQYKSQVRTIQTLKQSNSKDKDEKIKTLHQEYITSASAVLSKVSEIHKLVCKTESISGLESKYREEITYFITEAYHQIDLIRRRILLGEKIPHYEKIFSVFESYTRWISKGKAGVPVEFGLPVTILKDQFGLIIDYEIMEHTSDIDVVLPLLKRAIEEYKNIRSCSFDKGFWSKEIIADLRQQIQVVIRRKGRPTAEDKKQLEDKEYVKLLNHHSAVESTINGLEHSGLDKCPDKGIQGFKRYVGLAIFSRNLQIIGKKIREEELKRTTDKRYKQAS